MIDDFLLTKEEIEGGFIWNETGYSLNRKLKGMYMELKALITGTETFTDGEGI